ncbi:glycosyltransferase [Metabacillus halosaccharovorans]|uniref:glycosyltransferase n=1 Tax=Metabacillus halosaccharovorans TaxID=930124 RepID=UPI0009948EF8|nr:glycosyltransferase [Metabacillus halosaccharovorans]
MKHIIVYFPYELQENPKSGSGVRPKKIVEAFKKYCEEENLELVLISGTTSERQNKIEQYKARDEYDKALFCYMENSTMPYWFTDPDRKPRNIKIDSGFWNVLKQKNIPISLFYRDVYWQFDDMYVPPKGIKFLRYLMRQVYKQELKTYQKYVDVLYLPSLEMNKYVGWQGNVSELPPGMEKVDISRKNMKLEKPYQAVFVGGISDQVGMLMLLEAFKVLNENEHTINLELVCRENEYNNYDAMQKYEQYSWLKVSHLSGQQLVEVYDRSHVALIPREKNAYHDFAVPVKLFEYLAYNLPVVATDCDAQARLLTEEGFGVVSKVDAAEYGKAILELLQPDKYMKTKQAIAMKAWENHSWYARVRKVADDMLRLKEKRDKA